MSLTSASTQAKIAAVEPAAEKAGGRVLSLDAYRGLVIVVMTYVNYLSPVKNIPMWAKHWPEYNEGYTFVDVVFPAFLFIVGVAIPFALQRRLDKGDSVVALIGKILVRSAALIFLGVLTVNAHEYAAEATPLPRAVWIFLVMTCTVAVWVSPPTDASATRRNAHWYLRIAGVAGLAWLLYIFRGHDDAGKIVWMQHE
jgi:heparan-alpha-glucosaminide N-acetyltransferase